MWTVECKGQSHVGGLHRAGIDLMMFVNKVRGKNFCWTSFEVIEGMISLLIEALCHNAEEQA